ncbi:MAG: response regulator [Syntrophobacteraceae bacterium]
MAENDLKQKVVLMADDDLDDVILVRKALQECNCDVDFRSVEDGEEAIEYLTGEGRYKEPGSAPRPSLILLDVDMPKKDGLQTLQEIRNNPEIRTIPVVVLTTSRDRDLMLRIYKLGGSAFITKPTVYKDIIKALDRLCAYWFQTVSLPDKMAGESSIPDGRIEGIRKDQA